MRVALSKNRLTKGHVVSFKGHKVIRSHSQETCVLILIFRLVYVYQDGIGSVIVSVTQPLIGN